MTEPVVSTILVGVAFHVRLLDEERSGRGGGTAMHSSKMLFPILVLSTISLSGGCATQKALTRSELSGLSSVEVVKLETPAVQVKTLAGGILMALGGWVTAPVGAAHDESVTKEMRSQGPFPDFGELLIQGLVARAPEEVPGWPSTTVTRDVSTKHQAADRGAVFSFELKDLWLTVLRGFTAQVTGTLTDASGKTLWKRHFWFRSWDFGRTGKQEEYLRDNYALLKGEIEMAARDTATVMLRDIKQGL